MEDRTFDSRALPQAATRASLATRRRIEATSGDTMRPMTMTMTRRRTRLKLSFPPGAPWAHSCLEAELLCASGLVASCGLEASQVSPFLTQRTQRQVPAAGSGGEGLAGLPFARHHQAPGEGNGRWRVDHVCQLLGNKMLCRTGDHVKALRVNLEPLQCANSSRSTKHEKGQL